MTPFRITLSLMVLVVCVLLAAGCVEEEKSKSFESMLTSTTAIHASTLSASVTSLIPTTVPPISTAVGVPNSTHASTPVPTRPRYMAGEVIVRYNSSLSNEQFIQISTALNAEMGEKNPTNASVHRMPYIQLVHVPSNISVESAIAFYEKNESVDRAQPNYIYYAITTL